jgi:hypothetical protein
MRIRLIDDASFPVSCHPPLLPILRSNLLMQPVMVANAGLGVV